MKRLLIAIACLLCSLAAFAQNAEEPASRDDVILYLRTMRSHDMLQRTMEVQAQSMHQLFRDMIAKEAGEVPPDFDTKFKAAMDDLIKNMPTDQIVDAMIPAYQKHFTKGDIQAMNAFYSSPVGQKVLQELPGVLQDGNQAALPIMSKYLSEWKDRFQHEFEQKKNSTPPTTKGSKAPDTKN
ncbi:MAG TPA: DUF2059 domain-containing protein [Candidatus Dormibacteraeota bacterium]|nr:DUF2059 domain-containing protein [Candidatus Dormibacteraeota bacterium]